MLEDLMLVLQNTEPVQLGHIFPELTRLEIGGALLATQDKYYVLHALQATEDKDPEPYREESSKIRENVIRNWTNSRDDSGLPERRFIHISTKC